MMLINESHNDEQPASNSDLSAPLKRRANNCTAVAFHDWSPATAACIATYKTGTYVGIAADAALGLGCCIDLANTKLDMALWAC